MLKEKKISKERRKSPRVKGGFDIEISNKEAKIIANTLDLSSSGIYCQTDKMIPLFREIQMSIALPEMDREIMCAGVVVRSERAQGKNVYNLAVFFEDIEPEDKKLISDFVEKRLAK